MSMNTPKSRRYTRTTAERLAERLIRMPNGCLEWTGHKRPTGYGQINVGGKIIGTHRLAWALVNGPIPDGIGVLHQCDNPPCCDPEHLFLGTPLTNAADKIAKGRDQNQRKTHCVQGHPFDEANTNVDRRGWRQCLTCRRAS